MCNTNRKQLRVIDLTDRDFFLKSASSSSVKSLSNAL